MFLWIFQVDFYIGNLVDKKIINLFIVGHIRIQVDFFWTHISDFDHALKQVRCNENKRLFFPQILVLVRTEKC